jgi:hypothetical protein
MENLAFIKINKIYFPTTLKSKLSLQPCPEKNKRKTIICCSPTTQKFNMFFHMQNSHFPEKHMRQNKISQLRKFIWKVKNEIKFRENLDFLEQNSVGFQISTVQVLISRNRNA